ncbi:hypothetical protein DFH06DRAFT_1020248 [Mycena polygramma]|nr:hypothetical protein DFH06DRAFT_1020248 [Mycena polygramma]
MRGANLRRWLARKDCPEVIRQFKRVFDLAFTSQPSGEQDEMVPGNDREKAHHRVNGVNFSRASTHLGNSLVIYCPPGETTAVAGSIEKIEIINNQATFIVRRQKPLSPGEFDPFKAFPYFPATSYSSQMSTAQADRVNPACIISHCARFQYSKDRVVILNLSRVRLFPLYCCDSD